MTKPIVFISHITEEKELAQKLKILIEESFLGMMKVFVSSDESSIALGEKWLNNISDSLDSCAIELILCSPKSIQRPWINFEAGAGWVRNIPVIPLCHSGMEPSNLPIPLNLLQSIKLSEVSGLKLLFPVLSKSLDAKEPKIDFSDFVTEVITLEEHYCFWDDCNACFAILHKINPELIQGLKTYETIVIDLTEHQIRTIEENTTPFFIKNKLLYFSRQDNTNITTSGTFYRYKITTTPELKNIFKNPNFKIEI